MNAVAIANELRSKQKFGFQFHKMYSHMKWLACPLLSRCLSFTTPSILKGRITMALVLHEKCVSCGKK